MYICTTIQTTRHINMAEVIAILNYKGGCAKTTTTINLGAALSLLGKSVLLVDVDFQCNLTSHLGFDPLMGNTIYDVFTNRDIKEMPVYEYSKNLDYIPSSNRMELFQEELMFKHNREYMLRTILKVVSGSYDYILIDCPSNGGLLNTNAMAAADHLIIPVVCEPYAVQGISSLLSSIEEIKSAEVNKDLDIMGFLITKYDSRLNLHRSIDRALRERYHVFNARIRMNTTISQCSAMKQSIFKYDINSNGAQDYEQLARELTGTRKKIKR